MKLIDITQVSSESFGFKKEPLIVAYYTPGAYAKCATKLIDSLEQLGMAYEIQQVESMGNWVLNTQLKADFLAAILEKHSIPLLYVDVDAIIHSNPLPYLTAIDCDVALHYYRNRELLSGTIWLNPTPLTFEVIRRWQRVNRNKPYKWDQKNLAEAIRGMEDLQVFKLPPEYAFIFDKSRRLYPNTEPIIEHFQASRKFKRIINNAK